MARLTADIDLHPGNVCFPAPETRDLDEGLYPEPKRTYLRRRDGAPLSRNLPEWVVEPIALERGSAKETKIVDLGRSFLLSDSGPWTSDDFGLNKPERPPELLTGNGSTLWPQKVDSWSMAVLVS